MLVLKSRPFGGKLSKKEIGPSNMVLSLGCGLYKRAGKGGKQGGLFHAEALEEAELEFGHSLNRGQPLFQKK